MFNPRVFIAVRWDLINYWPHVPDISYENYTRGSLFGYHLQNIIGHSNYGTFTTRYAPFSSDIFVSLLLSMML